jgi:hypothetical protein
MGEKSIPVLYAHVRRFTKVVVEEAFQHIALLRGASARMGVC